jgi:hypothetical protein
MVSKAGRLGELGRGAEQIAVYDDVITRFGTAKEPALREQVAKALLNKASALRRMMSERGGDQTLTA